MADKIIKFMNYNMVSKYSLIDIQKVLESYGLQVIFSSNELVETIRVMADDELLFSAVFPKETMPRSGGVLTLKKKKKK